MEPITKESDLDKALAGMNEAFVLFYASWCPFSRRFLPVFEDHVRHNKLNALRVMVDDLDSVTDKYSIEVFPTVLFFEKGKVSKRLDGAHGEGLDEGDLMGFVSVCRKGS